MPIAELVAEKLGAPLAMEVPSHAINVAEAEYGQGKAYRNVTTLHCSLGFGMGVRKQDPGGARVEFGRVLTRAMVPDGSGGKLDAYCGGISFLNETIGAEQVACQSDIELGRQLVELVERSGNDRSLAELLAGKGRLTAQALSLTLDLIRPEMLILAGPLAGSRDYVRAFEATLAEILGTSGPLPELATSSLTPTGASRLLALSAVVAMGNLDLNALKIKDAT